MARRKEKELTLEEAMELAIEELKPFWYGSKPLLAAFDLAGERSVRPLDPKFQEGIWLIYFLNPTEFETETALLYSKEWQHRFRNFDFKTLIVIEPVFERLLEKAPTKSFIELNGIKFPLVIDRDFEIAGAFGDPKDIPRFVLCSKGEIAINSSGKKWLSEVEDKIQDTLRSGEPGLPLAPSFVPEVPPPRDDIKIDFGLDRGATIVQRPSKEDRTDEYLEKLRSENGVEITGNWEQTADCLTTEDPKATITFFTDLPRLAVAVRGVTKTAENGKLVVELDGTSIHDIFTAKDIKYDDAGRTYIECKDIRLYHAIQQMTDDTHEITFKTPMAKSAPIELFGIRLSSV